MMADKKEIPSGEDGIKENTVVRETVHIIANGPEMMPPAVSIHPFGIDPIAVSRVFMVNDLAKSGLVPSDFPFPPVPVAAIGGRGAYQLYYSATYYKLKIDRDNDKYVGIKGVVPPVVVLGNHYQAPITASVEGLKKALAFHIATGIPTLAIDSCWGFGETAEQEDGLKVKDLHIEIIQQLYPGQSHIVIFDGDWSINDNVRLALATYKMLLEEQGLKLKFVDVGTDEHGEKRGIDDWLVGRYSNDRTSWPEPLQVLEAIFTIPNIPNEELLGGAQSFALHTLNRFSKDYLDLTDRGACSLIVKLIGVDNFKFIEDTGKWVMWEGGKWKDLGQMPVDLVDIAAQHYLRRAQVLSTQAAKMDGNKELEGKMKGLLAQAKEFARFGKGPCSSQSGRRKIIDALETSRRDLRVRVSMFDNIPYLLGVANGVVDLRTGELREEKQEDMLLRHCPVKYVENPPSRFTVDGVERDLAEFIVGMTGTARDANMVSTPDPALAAYHQARTGAMLWGTNALQGLDLWHGPAATAKSSFLQMVRGALGNTDVGGYYAQLSPGVIMSAAANRDPEAATPVLIRALGARIIGMSESKDTQVFNETLVKQLSGDLTINGRANYHDATDIRVTFNAILLANDLPACNTADTAFLERVAVIPFEVRWRRDKIEFSDEDAGLPDGDRWWVDEGHLHEGVREYVLWWLIQGCKQWKAMGKLPPAPERVVSQLRDYVHENDVFTDWMIDCRWVFDNEDHTLSGDLYRSFKSWMDAAGRKAPNNKAFSKRLLKRFPRQLRTHKGTGNTNHIWGIRLADNGRFMGESCK